MDMDMDMDVLALLPVEKEALLEALRRDLRSEKTLAKRGSDWVTWHQRNVQLNLRLLEALNPKRQGFAKQVCKDSLPKTCFIQDCGDSMSDVC